MTDKESRTPDRARELREYVQDAPAAGTYRSEQGLDERIPEDSAPADTRSEVAEKYEP